MWGNSTTKDTRCRLKDRKSGIFVFSLAGLEPYWDHVRRALGSSLIPLSSCGLPRSRHIANARLVQVGINSPAVLFSVVKIVLCQPVIQNEHVSPADTERERITD